jgi:coenzyme Q-binding protein COQ10
MPQFRDSRTLEYTARQIYDLVIDIEKYPEFVPWCSRCDIVSNQESEIVADLEVSFGPFKKSYISKITHGVLEDGYYIYIEKISGQFRKLDTKWEFRKQGVSSCIVDFKIEFEFESIIASSLISGFFETATKVMIEAFEDRARSIYGNN